MDGLPVGDLLREPYHRQALRPRFHDQPLHGVHAAGLRRGDLEVLVVEHLRTLAVGLVDAERLPGLRVVDVGRVVGVHVPARHGYLDHRVGGGLQAREERPLVVEGRRQAGHAVDDVEVVVPRRLRRALPPQEPGRVPREPARREPWGRREEAREGHQRLRAGVACVLEDVRPEEQHGVGAGRDLDGLGRRGEVPFAQPAGVLEQHLGSPGAAEGHGAQDRPPPCLEEGPQDPVVRLGERVLGLLRRGQR
mmetsp:Transcript_47877/g.135257  ORF Transcript_47877/g.135257 Transcript_47877/m.135257 type:complete len:250 (-) Transcript_47877:70-819(-)